jgi:hypothetical protein
VTGPTDLTGFEQVELAQLAIEHEASWRDE